MLSQTPASVFLGPAELLLPDANALTQALDSPFDSPVLTEFTPTERKRLSNLKQPLDKRDFLAAHLGIRQLARKHHLPATIPLALEYLCPGCGSREHGKPFLYAQTSKTGLEISLSHSGGYVALACQDRTEHPSGAGGIGIDIENVRLDNEVDLPAWTRTEALIKAGFGTLDAPLSTPAKGYALYQFEHPNFIGALCLPETSVINLLDLGSDFGDIKTRRCL